jgi:DNA polymerase elongation subunit (family B)
MFVPPLFYNTPEKNPVVEVYKGINIRKCNRYVFKFGPVMFKRLIIESEETGLPISKILIHSSRPCERCIGVDVITYNREGEQIKVKRGLLSQHIPMSTGRSIIQQSHENGNGISKKAV